MDNSPYLVFELEELNYAVEATLVQEIFPLPALMPIADAPRDVVGILNYRGKVLPVIHLAKRLGQGNPTCKLQDNVIVINGPDCQIGLVVETVKDVRIIPESNFEPGPNYGRINEINTAFISRIAKLEDQVLAVVLNVDTLIREPAAVANVSELDAEAELPLLPTNFFDLYCPGASPQAQSLFEARTVELQTGQSQILAEQTREIAVFRLGEEYFGFEATQVREFIKVPPLTPIPCCPNHILGNANLRGEVITLVDIAHCLSLPMVEANPLSPAIVVTVGEFTVAIAADEILDVQVVPSSSINPLPSVMPRPGSDFLQGTTRFATRTLSLLDLEKLLIEGDLMVDEAI